MGEGVGWGTSAARGGGGNRGRRGQPRSATAQRRGVRAAGASIQGGRGSRGVPGARSAPWCGAAARRSGPAAAPPAPPGPVQRRGQAQRAWAVAAAAAAGVGKGWAAVRVAPAQPAAALRWKPLPGRTMARSTSSAVLFCPRMIGCSGGGGTGGAGAWVVARMGGGVQQPAPAARTHTRQLSTQQAAINQPIKRPISGQRALAKSFVKSLRAPRQPGTKRLSRFHTSTRGVAQWAAGWQRRAEGETQRAHGREPRRGWGGSYEGGRRKRGRAGWHP